MTSNANRFTARFLKPPLLQKWNLPTSDFFLFVSLLLLCIYFGSLGLGKLALQFFGEETQRPSEIAVLLLSNIGMQLGMLFAFLAFLRYARASNTQQTRLSAGKSIKVGLKWLAITYPIMFLASYIAQVTLNLLGFERVIQEPIRVLLEADSKIELGLAIVSVVLVAPICEEVIFRGALFRFLHKRMPLVVSLLVSGALFALPHANLYNFVALLIVGIMLALAYRESGSLLSCITFHAVFNTINLTLILLFPDTV